jgi:hypothetical protein
MSAAACFIVARGVFHNVVENLEAHALLEVLHKLEKYELVQRVRTMIEDESSQS